MQNVLGGSERYLKSLYFNQHTLIKWKIISLITYPNWFTVFINPDKIYVSIASMEIQVTS